MKVRWAAALAIAIAAVFGVAACTNTASTPGSSAGATIPLLTAGSLTGTSSLSPVQNQGCATDFCGLFMERLLKYGPNGVDLEPELATSWAQTSPVTYVYHLRHGVKFWDGNEMTSADVVNALNYERAPEAMTATFFTSVKGVEATDRYTVAVTLTRPDARWPYTLAWEGVIYEKSFQDAHKAAIGNPGVLIQATGPWKVDSFDPTRGLELSANPRWWGGKVPIQHISIKFFSEEKSEALGMRAGEINVAFPTDGRTFAATSGARLTSWLSGAHYYFGMNTTLAPWSDIHVRRAVAYALNRSDIIAASGGPASGKPLYTLLGPPDLSTIGSKSQVDALLKSLPQYRLNLAKARQEIASSAYPHGFTATLDSTDYGNFSNIVQVIAAELQEIGITLKLNITPISKFVNELYGPKTFGPMFTSINAASPDPGTLPGFMLGSENAPAGGLNIADYIPAMVDKLLAEGIATNDSAKRLAIYGQILEQVATDVPYVPLYQTYAFAALSSKFTLPALHVAPYAADWALDIRRAA